MTDNANPPTPAQAALSADERQKRWRLILGGSDADGIGIALEGGFAIMDRALTSLYEAEGSGRLGGTGGSSPSVARWLGGHTPILSVHRRARDAA